MQPKCSQNSVKMQPNIIQNIFSQNSANWSAYTSRLKSFQSCYFIPGLAFIVYPEAVTAMEISPLFSFLFFFMLTLLAISSVCGSWEAFITAVLDEFPSLKKKRVIVMIVSCFIAFLAGFPICFQSGFFLFQTMDKQSANAASLMGLAEVVVISWFYGADRFFGHVEEMGMKMPKVMKGSIHKLRGQLGG